MLAAPAGLEVAWRLMLDEGIEPFWSRHAQVATRCRQDGHDFGLKLFACEEHFAASAMPAFKVPERIG